jgi:hypothetical protein
MKKSRRQTRYTSSLVVHVCDAQGLIDMMRYDNCYPSTEEESYKIGRLINGSAEPADHFIRLTRVAGSDNPPTEGRWKSFRSTVIDYRDPETSPISDDEIKNWWMINGR